MVPERWRAARSLREESSLFRRRFLKNSVGLTSVPFVTAFRPPIFAELIPQNHTLRRNSYYNFEITQYCLLISPKKTCKHPNPENKLRRSPFAKPRLCRSALLSKVTCGQNAPLFLYKSFLLPTTLAQKQRGKQQIKQQQQQQPPKKKLPRQDNGKTRPSSRPPSQQRDWAPFAKNPAG